MIISTKPPSDRYWYAKPHRWFAWFPVRVDSGEVVWLETVERVDRDTLHDLISWKYRRV